VAGLCGTGSDDIEIRDVFVPAGRSFSLFEEKPPRPEPLYAFPVFGLLALGIGATALGIGRAAIDEIIRLAGVKTTPGRATTIAGKSSVRATVARAESLLGAGRAWLSAAVDDCWRSALAGDPATPHQRAQLRLAVAHAATSAARAVDLAYHAGGGTSVYTTSPLQRFFRDVHVATQHAMVGPDIVELAGAVLLGQPVDTARL
jgi:alkylation response protein AidB-like acyl-CoA dehydrogenase